MLKRFTRSLVLLPLLLLSTKGQQVSGATNSQIGVQKSGQTEATGLPVEVVSGSQYNASFGLIGRDEGTHYLVRSADTVFLLSCNRQWRWEAKCPVLAAGEKFNLAIDPKNHVHLTGAKGDKPVDIKLEYRNSQKLPLATTMTDTAMPQKTRRDLAPTPISDSGNIFLNRCDTTDNAIAKEGCKVWVDGFINGMGSVQAQEGLHHQFEVCFPNGVETEQSFQVIVKYIKDHPQDAHLPTAILSLMGLHAAFPCAH
jgi:hypothetical protein